MSGTAPKITLARKSGVAAAAKRILGVTRLSAYVGVPASTAGERSAQLLEMAAAPGKAGKKVARLRKAAEQDVNNAELLFVFSKGSPARGQKARPVLEPAMAAEGNRESINRELSEAARADIKGDHEAAVKRMKRAALAGQNAARRWFTDPRNHWAPNAPSTIARKGSDRPGIDTGAMRAAIIGLVKEE